MDRIEDARRRLQKVLEKMGLADDNFKTPKDFARCVAALLGTRQEWLRIKSNYDIENLEVDQHLTRACALLEKRGTRQDIGYHGKEAIRGISATCRRRGLELDRPTRKKLAAFQLVFTDLEV